MLHFNEIQVTEAEIADMQSRYNISRDSAITMAQLRKEKIAFLDELDKTLADESACAKQVIDTSDGPDDGCPYCGSYEGNWQECPECGHGQ